jgi:hypothetical protein
VERFFPVRTAHSQEKRRFSDRDEPDPMMDDNKLKSKFPRSLLRYPPQLMFGHFPMRFVIDSLDLPSVFNAADNAPKINGRAGCGIAIIFWRFKRRLRQ